MIIVGNLAKFTELSNYKLFACSLNPRILLLTPKIRNDNKSHNVEIFFLL